MAAKFGWYNLERDAGREIDQHIHLQAREYIQKIINLYYPKIFNFPDDINLDNLQKFLEIILSQYSIYNIHYSDLRDIGDILDSYYKRLYSFNLFENCDYREYFTSKDRRQLSIEIIDNCMSYFRWFILPEDVPFILECLNAPEDQIELMYDKLDQYFEQFDRSKRFDEVDRRWKIITKQRIEALQKGEPLPIRPMGIELDMCYNTK